MPPVSALATANVYEPRCAQSALLYSVVAAELDSFLAAAKERDHPLPAFVETTFRDFLTCGIAKHGFVRVHCDHCGRDRVVAFSCKRRGLCNSCAGRRMAETAAHLVDHVLPEVPMRQWVLSLPFPLRYRLAYDRKLATPLLAAFLRAVFASLRRRARDCYGISRCATLGGFSLHAGVAVGATDRAGLERLLRYMARPALASERLERLADGRILYRFRHRWRDGTSALVFEPREFLARLAAQVPPPRAHQFRYHGLLGPSAAWRGYVVPAPEAPQEPAGDSSGCSHERSRVPRVRRIAWSDLLRRVFAVDALQCDRCGSRMRVMAAGRLPRTVAAFLACTGLAGRSPPMAQERGARAEGSPGK